MKNFRNLLFLVFAVLTFLVSCGGSEGSSEGKVCESCGIYGHVTDYETGEDVANASVQLRPGGDTTLTGSDGMFEFRGLPAGDYSITVSKAGYSDLVDDFVITVRDRMVRRDVQIVNTECKGGGYWNGSKCDFPPCDTKDITPCRQGNTNYIWSERSLQSMNWDSAQAYCNNLTQGGYSDWSLPPYEIFVDAIELFPGYTVYWSSFTPCYSDSVGDESEAYKYAAAVGGGDGYYTDADCVLKETPIEVRCMRRDK